MSDDIATQKLNELKEKAKSNFSETEIEDFITMGKKLAGKSVLSALIAVLKEGPSKGFSPSESAKLIKKVTQRIPYNHSGFISMGFKEIAMTLNVTLSIVDRTYKTDIDIPHASYAKQLFEFYDFLKNTAIAYWRQFAEENKELYNRICNYRSDVVFSELVIDENSPTTMYFDPNSATRVGIFCYYVDQSGKPFYKKTSCKK